MRQFLQLPAQQLFLAISPITLEPSATLALAELLVFWDLALAMRLTAARVALLALAVTNLLAAIVRQFLARQAALDFREQ